MNLRPSLHKPLLRFRKTAAQAFDRVCQTGEAVLDNTDIVVGIAGYRGSGTSPPRPLP